MKKCNICKTGGIENDKHIANAYKEPMEWESERKKLILEFAEHADGIGADYVRDEELDNLKQFIATQIKQAEERGYSKGFDEGGQTKGGTGRIMYQRGQEEERQFILNILDGQDKADEELGVLGGTKAIRLALKSRV